MTTRDDGPVPLRLPSILQNPVNKTQRQVEAFNAQQREKAAARREADKAEAQIVGSRRGKRVVRRMNNDAFLDNPHAVAYKRTDLAPAVPLHHRPLRPSFPATALERSVHIPAAPADRADPFGASSHSGAFSTSLKGTRALLRKRGRRSEVLVPVVEEAVRGWLAGRFSVGPDVDELSWRVVDASETEYVPAGGSLSGPGSGSGSGSGSGPASSSGASSAAAASSAPHQGSTSPPASRRMPAQHQLRAPLPPLPTANGTVPAILELSRSPAHISWAVPNSFDRLVVHLVARYYELVSWSEDQTTVTGDRVRLTHLVRPALVKPRPPPSHKLLTPETSDVSDLATSSESGTEHGGDTSDTATETGDHERDHADTVSEAGSAAYEADTSFRSLSLSERYGVDTDDEDGHGASLSERFGTLALHGNGRSDLANGHGGLHGLALNGDADAEHALHRTTSHGSSAYASSEGGSEAGLAGSMFAPSEPAVSPRQGTVGLPSAGFAAPSFSAPEMPRRLPGSGGGDWTDKPTFFEFVYGA